MSVIKRHLDVQTPLMWIVTDEGHRATAEIVEHSTRPVYRLDALQGLIVRDKDRFSNWKKVLVDAQDPNTGEMILVQVYDLVRAFLEVLRCNGLFIVDYAHFSSEKMVPFYGAVSRLFLDAVHSSRAKDLPCQLVLMSPEDKVPPELGREEVHIAYELPTPEDLEETLVRIEADSINAPTTKLVVRAGQGLSELEFIEAIGHSLMEHQEVRPDFVNHIKIETIKAAGLLEIRTPTLTIADIGGLDNLKTLIQQVAWLWSNPERGKEFKMKPLSKVLLVGVPGTGKSATCEATASALNLDLAKTGASQSMSKWVGESEANMRKVFAQIKAMNPIVLWIDEFGRDMSGSASSGASDGGTTDRVHGEFLTGLQELPQGVFLMCAANRIDGLPPEMTRADRFDKVVFIGLPTKSERMEIFKIHLGEEDAGNYSIEALAEHSDKFTGAEIKALVNEVRFQVGTTKHQRPSQKDFLEFMPRMKGRIWKNHTDAIITMYERAGEEWDWASSEQEAEAGQVLAAGRARANNAGHRKPTAPAPHAPAVPTLGSSPTGQL